MRKLMWTGAGFTAACLLGAYFISGAPLVITGVCVALIAIGMFLLSKKTSWQRAAALFLFGTAVGMLWFSAFTWLSLGDERKVDGQTVQIRAEATDYSYLTQYGTAVEAKIFLENKTCQAKVYLNDTVELSPGDRVDGLFFLQYTGPGGETPSQYHSGTGTFLLAFQRGELCITYGNDRSLTYFAPRLRRQLLQSIEGIFPADTAAFAKALLIGDTSDIDYKTDADLTSSGIVHVVSVSGLHVSILFSVLFFLLGRRKFLTPIAGTVLLLFAAAVTGFSPSIVRSCLMNFIMLLALMIDREYDPLTALSFALLVMLGINPLAATSVGLQLSAASVLGICLFAEGINAWIQSFHLWAEAKHGTFLARLRNWLAGTVSVSLSASIFTAPLTALHFDTVSLVGIFTNIAVLWVVNYVFVGIILAVILSSFWSWGATALSWLLAWGIRYTLAAAKLLGSFPMAAVYTESPYVVVWLVCAYCMLALFLATKGKYKLQLFLCVSLTLTVALGASYLEPRLDNMRLTVLDVGQGQCVLIQSGGRTYMVDCGGSRDEAAADKAIATLYSQGVFHLDGLILTHYDRDHVGGAAYLLSRMDVKQVYLPLGPGQSSWEPAILEAAGENFQYVLSDVNIQWDGAVLSVYAAAYRETSNESSLCVLFQKENYDILITGDQNVLGEMALVSEKELPDLEALVIGHHGSDSSTGEFLLHHTKPELALISVGADNGYGHPAPSVLARLKQYGCIIRRTDREGTIIIRR